MSQHKSLITHKKTKYIIFINSLKLRTFINTVVFLLGSMIHIQETFLQKLMGYTLFCTSQVKYSSPACPPVGIGILFLINKMARA